MVALSAETGRPQRAIREWVFVTLIVAAIAGCAAWQGWFWRSDLALYDTILSAHPHPPDPDVLIVAVDDASLARLGRWPWRRDVHAAMVDRLRDAGVRAIAFDVLFSEAAPEDPILASALRKQGHVVLPVGQIEREKGGLAEAPPVPELAAAAAALGHVQIEFDPDGIARSVYRREGTGAARFPLLADALRGVAEGRAPLAPPLKAPPGDGTWFRDGWLRFPFLGPPGTVPQVSYIDVLDGHVPASALKNKVVFVGATAAGMADSVPVPTSGFARPMPGVEVHAQLLAALRRHAEVSLAAPEWNTALAVALSFALMALLARLRARQGGLLTLCGLALTLAGTAAGALFAGVWVAPSASVLACTLAYPLWSWRRLEATQRYLDRELAGLGTVLEHPVSPNFDPLQERIAIVRTAAARQRAARSFLAATLDNLPIGVVVANPDGAVRLHNTLAATLLGSNEPAVLANGLRGLLGDTWAAGEHGAPVEFTTATGRNVRATSANVDTPEERIGIVLALADITDLRAAESLRDDALRFLSHDLRSPLASIIVLTDAISDYEMPPEPDTFERIGRHAQTALDRADSVLRLMQAGAIDPTRFEQVDLVRVILDAADEYWAQARRRNIRLTTDTSVAPEDEALVPGDVELLRRAVGNLVGNAIKYGDGDVDILIRLEDEGDRWSVAVCDHGPGIAPEDLPRLFQRSVRLAPKKAQGSGLGLAFVRTVAERHSGKATASSVKGKGSIFRLTLPKQRLLNGV